MRRILTKKAAYKHGSTELKLHILLAARWFFCFWSGTIKLDRKYGRQIYWTPWQWPPKITLLMTTSAIFSNLDANSQFLGPSSPAVSTDPEVMVISAPNFLATNLPNSAPSDGQYSPDSTSTFEASNNDLTVEAPTTAGVQVPANNSIEDQQEPPPADSFPNDGSPFLSHSNQLKQRAETTNWLNSRQHRGEHFASIPTEIIRPRINTRLRYCWKPEFDSWEIIFRDNQRKEMTIQKTSLPSQLLVVPLQAVTVLPH